MYTIKYYSTIKANKILIHVMPWIDFENFMLSEEVRQKAIHCMTSFICIVHKRRILINKTDERLSESRKGGNRK